MTKWMRSRSIRLAPGVLKTLTVESPEPRSFAISRFARRILSQRRTIFNKTKAPLTFWNAIPSGDQTDPLSTKSLAIRYPDILHLGSMLEEPAAFALLHVEPVDRTAFIGEHLLEISDRVRLGGSCAGFVRETPDGIYVVVLRQHLQKLGGIAGDDVDGSSWQIAGVENLIQVGGDQGISLGRN